MQTQNLFACEIMNDDTHSECCCDEAVGNVCSMGGGCDTSDSGLLTGCCHLSIQVEIGFQDIIINDVHHSKQVLSLDAAQPPPAIITAYIFTLPTLSASNKFILNNFSYSLGSLGRHTYIETNRYRI